MINNLKAWYRARRLAAAKRVLVEHIKSICVGTEPPANVHRLAVRYMTSIADEAFSVTSTLRFEELLAQAKPGAFVPIETGGRPIPKPEAWWIENRPAPRPWPSNTAREEVRRVATDEELKAQAASFADDEVRAAEERFGTPPAMVEERLAQAKPRDFVPVDTAGQAISEPSRNWATKPGSLGDQGVCRDPAIHGPRPANPDSGFEPDPPQSWPHPWPSNTAREDDRAAAASAEARRTFEKRAQDDAYAASRAPKGDHSI